MWQALTIGVTPVCAWCPVRFLKNNGLSIILKIMDSPLFLRIGLDTKRWQVWPQLSRSVTSILNQKVPVKTMKIWGHTPKRILNNGNVMPVLVRQLSYGGLLNQCLNNVTIVWQLQKVLWVYATIQSVIQLKISPANKWQKLNPSFLLLKPNKNGCFLLCALEASPDWRAL